jgi:hypothetical protein
MNADQDNNANLSAFICAYLCFNFPDANGLQVIAESLSLQLVGRKDSALNRNP